MLLSFPVNISPHFNQLMNFHLFIHSAGGNTNSRRKRLIWSLKIDSLNNQFLRYFGGQAECSSHPQMAQKCSKSLLLTDNQEGGIPLNPFHPQELSVEDFSNENL